MKILLWVFTFALLFCPLFLSCGENQSANYIADLPVLPESWISLLGDPDWRLEWVDPNGNRRIVDISCGNGPGNSYEIELPVTWTNPVTAWPYWPGYNLSPGLFKPAGALFPLDVSAGNKKARIRLSWEAGPDIVLYWELVRACSSGAVNQNHVKTPPNFNWPRFRELFSPQESTLQNEALRDPWVLRDPWLIDWRFVAERTIAANFDRCRLVPEAVKITAIPVPPGIWYGVSPFAEPLSFSENEMPVFPVRSGINVWVSAQGILKCSGETWIFTEFKN
ncbi:MAG: hypothetical protein LBH16_02520 [Treponema sp.]|jgi:hypothetical protein|nr:hypothetical protein [Treponema sp.]